MKQDMSANKGETKEQQEFVTSCVLALDGVQKYIRNFGFLAGYMAQNNDFALSDAQRNNLKKVTVIFEIKVASFMHFLYLQSWSKLVETNIMYFSSSLKENTKKIAKMLYLPSLPTSESSLIQC